MGYEPRAKQGSICGDACGTREAFDIEVNMPRSMQIYHLVIWEGATTNTVKPGLTPKAPFVCSLVNIPAVCLMPIDKK